MRWFTEEEDLKKLRKRGGFLWKPKTLNGQTRWLEFGLWYQKARVFKRGGRKTWTWDDIAWVYNDEAGRLKMLKDVLPPKKDDVDVSVKKVLNGED